MLADDHAVVRAGLELINAQADMEVVGQAVSGREAVRQAHSRQPDVIVLDVSMPDLDGAVAAEQIQRKVLMCAYLCLPATPIKGICAACCVLRSRWLRDQEDRCGSADLRHPQRHRRRGLHRSEPNCDLCRAEPRPLIFYRHQLAIERARLTKREAEDLCTRSPGA